MEVVRHAAVVSCQGDVQVAVDAVDQVVHRLQMGGVVALVESDVCLPEPSGLLEMFGQ